jgi:hypothetical protein
MPTVVSAMPTISMVAMIGLCCLTNLLSDQARVLLFFPRTHRAPSPHTAPESGIDLKLCYGEMASIARSGRCAQSRDDHSDTYIVDSHPGERTGRETSTSAVRAARQYYRYLGAKDQSRTFSASDVDERLVENVADVEAGNDENIRIAGNVGQNALCPC